ncbi:MAG: SemiSWEET transporter [Alphaproteobacteria bacterium]|nr:SemiSWEET transporter [Alphaproteobacteria bacterium]
MELSWAVQGIGLLAGALTTIAFLPQVVKTWKTRSTRDISLGMFLVLTSGVALWLIYGLLLGDLPLVAANSVTFLLAAIILYFKLRHG